MTMHCVAFIWMLFVFGASMGYAQNPNPDIDAPAGQCTVTGHVWKPGPQPIKVGETLTLTTAILRAGGIHEWNPPRKVRITRRNKNGQPDTLTFDLKAILEKPSDDPILRDGDRIFVP
jgi:protein involved in polysaccharide export with SLBB domain